MMLTIVLIMLFIERRSPCALEDEELDDDTPNEIMAYLEVESLLSNIKCATNDRELGDFLEKSVNDMHSTLDSFHNDQTKPESSSGAASRARSSKLMQKLISAYHSAILGECDRLKDDCESIGSRLVEINQNLGTDLLNVHKYLAALYERCQIAGLKDEQQQQQPVENSSWIDKLLAIIGF